MQRRGEKGRGEKPDTHSKSMASKQVNQRGAAAHIPCACTDVHTHACTQACVCTARTAHCAEALRAEDAGGREVDDHVGEREEVQQLQEVPVLHQACTSCVMCVRHACMICACVRVRV